MTPADTTAAPRFRRLRTIAIIIAMVLAAPILVIVMFARMQGSSGR